MEKLLKLNVSPEYQCEYWQYLKYKYSCLKNTTPEADPYLLAEFKRSIKKLEKDWPNIGEAYLDNLFLIETNEEFMCYTIIASELKMDILDKDLEFIIDLCVSLLENKNPVTFVKCAEVICQKFYDIMTTMVDVKINCYYSNFLEYIINFNLLNLSENDYNQIMRVFYNILEYPYFILFKPNDSLKDIYDILLAKINSNFLLFTREELKGLVKLKTLNNSSNEELKEIVKREILTIESEENEERIIIKRIINYVQNILLYPEAKLVRVNSTNRKEP